MGITLICHNHRYHSTYQNLNNIKYNIFIGCINYIKSLSSRNNDVLIDYFDKNEKDLLTFQTTTSLFLEHFRKLELLGLYYLLSIGNDTKGIYVYGKSFEILKCINKSKLFIDFIIPQFFINLFEISMASESNIYYY